MATGSPLMPRTQNFWHWLSWGQTRPQMAGRAFFSLIFLIASSNRFSFISAMKAGMSMSTGHPFRHWGFGHVRQRRASSMANCSV